ncbi:MAG: PAC2 family protein [Dehalococcoidia bacterium]|nr:PAC2 family protein [Dehalococcoidia bacterium]
MADYHLIVHRKPDVRDSSLVVGWSEDAGRLGKNTAGYLVEKLGGFELAEIDLPEFFPLGGVSVQDDVAVFPEGKFYCCQDRNLVVFLSSPPRAEWFRYLNSILDVAQYYCDAKRLYTVGGMVSFGAHTAPRELAFVVNCREMREEVDGLREGGGITYESPPGQRPTLSSYLLWAAKRRNIPGASLWVPVPFYLAGTDDPWATKKLVVFFDDRLGLGVDLADLDDAIGREGDRISQFRMCFPEIDHFIQKLESNLALSQEESETLVREMEGFLKKRA